MKPISLLALILISAGILLTLDDAASATAKSASKTSKKLRKYLDRQGQAAREGLSDFSSTAGGRISSLSSTVGDKLSSWGSAAGEQASHLLDEAMATGKTLRKKARKQFA